MEGERVNNGEGVLSGERDGRVEQERAVGWDKSHWGCLRQPRRNLFCKLRRTCMYSYNKVVGVTQQSMLSPEDLCCQI